MNSGGPFAWLTNLLGNGGNGGMLNPSGAGANPAALGGGQAGAPLPQANPMAAAGNPMAAGGQMGGLPGLLGRLGLGGRPGPANQMGMQNPAAGNPLGQNLAMGQAMKLMQQPQMQPTQWMPWMQQR